MNRFASALIAPAPSSVGLSRVGLLCRGSADPGNFDSESYPKPASGSTHWSVHSVAAETGISKTSVHRYFQLFGLQQHRTEGFKLSNDPFFVEKLHDVVGLYLSPPDNALVICVDEFVGQANGVQLKQPDLDLVRFEGSKIIEVRLFSSEQGQEDAFWGK